MAIREPKISDKAEEYLEAIYRLEKQKGSATTMELAKELEVVPGSITNTIDRLEKRGLVLHEPYKGVKLTKKGQIIAINVLRKHRLAECLLTNFLQLDWSEVHAAACELEHALSPEVLNALESSLGHPKTCPHGNPIPSSNGKVVEEEAKSLVDLNSGEEGVVIKIDNEESDTLKNLDSLRILPESHIKVKRKGPVNSPIDILVNGIPQKIDPKLAIHVFLREQKITKGEAKC